jgi:HEAT repeat protein
MKKWYQQCGLILMTALALELSGCAKGAAYLSRVTGRDNADQKLVDVDGKADKKGSTTSKKTDSLRDKANESQLAKKPTTKPKVRSGDDSKQELASAKDTAKSTKTAAARESSDPFQTEELEALAAARAKSSRKTASEFAELGDAEADGAAKASGKTGLANVEGSSRIQEVAHKVEDNLADIGDLPEWAQESSTLGRRETSQARDSVRPTAAETSTASQASTRDLNELAQKKPGKPAATRSPAAGAESTARPVDLAGLCPDAQGELKELLGGLKESDVDGLKRGIHRIGRMGPDAQAASPALTHLLRHKDGFVRTHSALALARMQVAAPEAVQTVVEGLKSPDPGLRSFAAAVLAEMGPQAGEALSTLAESLNDRDGYVRLHAAEVLIRYDRWSYQALDALLGGLKDKDENIRWLATYSLAELAPESQETIDALLTASRDPVMKVKIGAVYALGEIGPFAKSACGDLQALADSTSNQELHSAILYALQQIEQ